MIYVAQGHEKSVGIEIFLKSFLLLNNFEQTQFTLVCNKNTLIENLKNMKLDIDKINCLFLENSSNDSTDSTKSLLQCLKNIDKKDILLTMPTSKNQLTYQKKSYAGYTFFLRKFFKNDHISMIFKNENINTLLITDHVKLQDVTSTITSDLICNKVKTSLDNYPKYFSNPINQVLFSGINPHAGENGMLGDEESVIDTSIKELKSIYPKINFCGPYAGDTLLFHQKNSKNQLFVYMFHDQALSAFKTLNKFTGLNITLGLPFLRMSVDHGTAFDLYGKNRANYFGCYYLLKTATKIEKQLTDGT